MEASDIDPAPADPTPPPSLRGILAGRFGTSTKTIGGSIELKADTAKRQIEGYASIFGNVDHHGEIVAAGAFKKTLQERLPRQQVKLFFNHTEGIGMPISVTEDSRGLWTVSQVAKTQRGDEVLEFVEMGLASDMSIGYDVIQAARQTDDTGKDTGVTILQELRLYEYSAVYWGANPETTARVAKQLIDHLGPILGEVDGFREALARRGALSKSEQEVIADLADTFGAASHEYRALLGCAEEPPAAKPEPLGDVLALHSAIKTLQGDLEAHSLRNTLRSVAR